MREWWGDEHGPLVASGMESTDLFCRSVGGPRVERATLWRRLGQASPTPRALVLETRARIVGAAEDKSAFSRDYSRTNSYRRKEGRAAVANPFQRPK